jgi:hypothetical protein
MLTYFGYKRNEVGHVFNVDVAKWFEQKGFKTKSNIKMTELGNKKENKDLGDIDVLAYDSENNIIYVIECKNLEKAKTAKEMGLQIRNFLEGSQRWLYRHIERYKWIIGNKKIALKNIKTGDINSNIVPILLVNDIIPLQFMNTLEYPTENIITMSSLESNKSILNNAKRDYYPNSLVNNF